MILHLTKYGLKAYFYTIEYFNTVGGPPTWDFDLARRRVA